MKIPELGKELNIPEKIYMGSDSSGIRGPKIKHDSLRYYTIATLTGSNFKEAQRIADWLEDRWPNKKGIHLYKRHWLEILEEVKSTDLKCYVLLVDKEIFSGKFDKSNYNRIPFPGAVFDETTGTTKYTIDCDLHAKHGWLAVQDLINQKYKGPTEIRWEPELTNNVGWKLAKEKVKEHAENHLGPCDFQDAGAEYPLVKIADIISNFFHRQLKDSALFGDGPSAISLLRPNVRTMLLDLSENFEMYMEKDGEFKAW